MIKRNTHTGRISNDSECDVRSLKLMDDYSLNAFLVFLLNVAVIIIL